MPPNTVQEHVPCLTPQKCREPSRHFRFPQRREPARPEFVPRHRSRQTAAGSVPRCPSPGSRRRQGGACACPSAPGTRPGNALLPADRCRTARPPYAHGANVPRTGLLRLPVPAFFARRTSRRLESSARPAYTGPYRRDLPSPHSLCAGTRRPRAHRDRAAPCAPVTEVCHGRHLFPQ